MKETIVQVMRRAAVLSVICWTGVNSTASAAMLPGSEPKKWPANPAKHQVVVQRTAADETEKKMIALAEAAYPKKEDVVAAGNLQPVPADDKLWSHKDVQGVRIPYAITGAAITWYTKFVQDAAAKEFTRFIEPSSKLEYTASVQSKENFEINGKPVPHVYVVKMKLVFDESFVAGGTEAIHFAKEREVVLDPAGKVLKITGDGDTEVPVLAI